MNVLKHIYFTHGQPAAVCSPESSTPFIVPCTSCSFPQKQTLSILWLLSISSKLFLAFSLSHTILGPSSPPANYILFIYFTFTNSGSLQATEIWMVTFWLGKHSLWKRNLILGNLVINSRLFPPFPYFFWSWNQLWHLFILNADHSNRSFILRMHSSKVSIEIQRQSAQVSRLTHFIRYLVRKVHKMESTVHVRECMQAQSGLSEDYSSQVILYFSTIT